TVVERVGRADLGEEGAARFEVVVVAVDAALGQAPRLLVVEQAQRAGDLHAGLALDGGRRLERAVEQALVRAAHGDHDAELGRSGDLRAAGCLHHAVDVEPGRAHGRGEARRLRAERAVLAAASRLAR